MTSACDLNSILESILVFRSIDVRIIAYIEHIILFLIYSVFAVNVSTNRHSTNFSDASSSLEYTLYIDVKKFYIVLYLNFIA